MSRTPSPHPAAAAHGAAPAGASIKHHKFAAGIQRREVFAKFWLEITKLSHQVASRDKVWPPTAKDVGLSVAARTVRPLSSSLLFLRVTWVIPLHH
mmetsp:Transcript_41232/g.69342  ORF Transcript_41232/g.69342 Transcript_41232/m.69342 type:complete len:96 (-) Transcript_41232:1733-2020(-)